MTVSYLRRIELEMNHVVIKGLDSLLRWTDRIDVQVQVRDGCAGGVIWLLVGTNGG